MYNTGVLTIGLYFIEPIVYQNIYELKIALCNLTYLTMSSNLLIVVTFCLSVSNINGFWKYT